MTDIVYRIACWVAPIVLGPVVYLVMREVLNVHRRVDDWPPTLKRVAVVMAGTAVVAVLNALGVAVPAECATFPNELLAECASSLSGPTVVRGVTAAMVAFGIHAARKARP